MELELEGVLGTILSILIGVIGGTIISVYNVYSAQSHVRVRPDLADVGVVDALLANHLHDWVFYHYPIPTSIVIIAFVTALSVAVWRWG